MPWPIHQHRHRADGSAHHGCPSAGGEEIVVSIHDLPAFNAVCNGTSSVLLLAAYISIKLNKVRMHAWLIIFALVMSALFLTGYLTYHAHVGPTHVDTTFPNVSRALRTTYKLILFPHL